MPQRGFEKVANGDRGYSVLFPARFEANQIRLDKLNFGGVFNQQNAFIRRNELSKRVQERRLARARSTAHQEVALLQNVIFETVR